MEPVAHSPRTNIQAQLYREHIENVRQAAVSNAQRATTWHAQSPGGFIESVEAAAIYHDLGKLDEANQEVLRRVSTSPLPVAHEDAGVAELKKLGRQEAAVLVQAHHSGLFSQENEKKKGSQVLRNLEVASLVDQRLDRYVSAHVAAGCPGLSGSTRTQLHKVGLMRRIALSCVVDADHSDTARHYGEPQYTPPEPRWEDRIEALDRYVACLPRGDTPAERRRNALRSEVYSACASAQIGPAMRSCDAPVGTGKTTAVMAYLLRAAAAQQLRHIIVVLPYTNIINQSVKIYRDALTLPGERAEEVVAEHHHQADFQTVDIRQFSTLWRASVIVTTAVQFFETLAGYHPARLRKLHELPGSAVFVDETHATLPSHLWPQMWQWLELWTREWGGHIVFASGSLPHFWEIKEFLDQPKGSHDVPDLLPSSLRKTLEEEEKVRIRPRRRVEPMDVKSLTAWIREEKGPRLVVMNTVQSAAVVAQNLRKEGHDTFHLSTALAPVHRATIVERVKDRLQKKDHSDWTLVATSCVEAGMEFSFRTGFRESCSVCSLIQLGGRINRHATYPDAEVWDFRAVDRPLLTRHSGFELSRRVLDRFLNDGAFSKLSPSDLAREAMRGEYTEGAELKKRALQQAESKMEYPEVAKLSRVIDSDTRTVVIDPSLVEALRRGDKVDGRQLFLHSVQIWATKIGDLPLEPIFAGQRQTDKSSTLYAWTADYDPEFLGYMAGVMDDINLGKAGYAVI